MHNILAFVTIDGVRYSVPPKVLGQFAEVRRRVGSQRLEVRTVAHRRRIDVWDPEHRRQAEAAATAGRPRRPVLRLVASSPEPARVDVGGEFDGDPVDLVRRYPVTPRDSEAQR